MNRSRRPVLVAVARGIYEIPRLYCCDWRPPDYRVRPHRRLWTLPAAKPGCRIHGTPEAEMNGAAA